MADEKKLTNEQLDEVAGGIGGSVVQSGVAGSQVVVDQSLNSTVYDASTNIFDSSKNVDMSSNPWIEVDDITTAQNYHEGDNTQTNLGGGGLM